MTTFNKSLNSLKLNLGIKKNSIVKNNSIDHNSITNFLIIGAAVLLIVFLLIIAYRFMDSELKNRYNSIKFFYDDNNNIEKSCPEGCDRGLCIQDKVCYDPFPPNPKCCAFDNQCRFCKDKSGIIIATDEQTVRDSIRNRYYKQYDSVKELNRDINNENQYISKLNDEIRKRNKSTLNLPDTMPSQMVPSSIAGKPTGDMSSKMPPPSIARPPTVDMPILEPSKKMPGSGSDEILEQGDTGQKWMCVKPYDKGGSNTREQLESCEFGIPSSGQKSYNDRPSCINRCYK